MLQEQPVYRGRPAEVDVSERSEEIIAPRGDISKAAQLFCRMVSDGQKIRYYLGRTFRVNHECSKPVRHEPHFKPWTLALRHRENHAFFAYARPIENAQEGHYTDKRFPY